MNMTDGEWCSSGIEVRIKEHEDPGLSQQIGTVSAVTGGMCTVFLPAEDRTVSISCELLGPVRPKQNDCIKIIHGEHKDQTGVLTSIDSVEGVVSLSSGNLTLLPMDYLCKMPSGSQ